jgi:hypothetical protein
MKRDRQTSEQVASLVPAGADCTRVLDFHTTAAAVPLVWSWLPDNWCAVTQTISRLIEN